MEEDEFFRLLTPESLTIIDERIAEAKAIKKAEKQAHEEGEEEALPTHEEENLKPNPKFETGKKLPLSLKDVFPPEFTGKPIEEIDEYYDGQKTFCVVGKDQSIFRFSGTNALYILSPFNPIRRGAVYVLVHPLFNALIIITIIINCAFMAMTENPYEFIEYIFTGVYTLEALIKISARGFILNGFTYLRDPWNWLDFSVIMLAYATIGKDAGSLAAIRTFRVLRALKTVAVIPGLKTIVGALLEAVRRLRDVMILTVFMLSIFALIGMQLYKGALRNKCVKIGSTNMTDEEYYLHIWSTDNWEYAGEEPLMCGNASGAGACGSGYTCVEHTHSNPNYNFTHFDNFGVALLCAFRLMTQDYWENLYMIVLRAQGPWHCLYFMIVILLGSFYLLNLILAIVAMSYDEQQKQDKADAVEEEEERKIQKELQEEAKEEYKEYLETMTKSPSHSSCSSQGGHPDPDETSIHSDKPVDDGNHLTVNRKPPSFSLPGSPFVRRTQSWKKSPKHAIPPNADLQPLVTLDISPNLPYADDSNAVTPCSDDLCNLTYKQFKAARRNSYASMLRRSGSSRRSSLGSGISRLSRSSRRSNPRSPLDKPGKLDTPWDWKKPKGDTHLRPNDVPNKFKSDDNDSTTGSTHEHEKKHHHNQVCNAMSATNVDPKDMLVLKNLLAHAEGHGGSLTSAFSFEEETLKDRLYKKFCSWTCCDCWFKFQKIVAFFILDAFVDLFITLSILVNTAFMAMDQHNKSEMLTELLNKGNYVFTAIFAAEAFLKVIALNPVIYLKDRWNCFDAVIVALSFIELALDGVSSLSVLRSFRLLRVFKLAKSWGTLNMLISIVARTLGALGNLTFVLGIVVFIFAVMGQQLFRDSYVKKYGQNVTGFEDTEMPRWNFTDFLHSFMIVFRVLCGEWIESMWGCTRVAGMSCVPFFLLTMVIGNLVVLNLFLALLLSSFGTENLSTDSGEDKEPNKIAEAVGRFKRFGSWIKVKVIVCLKVKMKRRPKAIGLPTHSPETSRMDINGKEPLSDGQAVIGNGTVCDTHPTTATDADPLTPTTTKTEEVVLVERHTTAEGNTPDSIQEKEFITRPSSRTSSTKSCKRGHRSSSASSISIDETKLSLTKVNADGEPEINEVDVTFANYPDDCFCKICRKKCACCIRVENTTIGKKWWKFRCKVYALVEHKYFETFIITMIIASSLALAIEDKYLPDWPILEKILYFMDKFFTVIFILEMLVKWVAFGWKKYFTDGWCWLDFVIVAISIVMLVGEATSDAGQIGPFKAMRTLRALRPLRAVSRWEGMRVVVNALIKAIPAIANVLLVCLVFWLIFGIIGVQFFAGKFYKCVDENGTKLDVSIVNDFDDCMKQNYTWINSRINFDNVLNAYLALLQVATYKGWIEVIDDAVDSREVGEQPQREENKYMYLYFVLFIIFGSFFTLNLFIGVIIDNFNQQKKKAGGSLEMFMTEDQKKYYKAMKRMASKSPQKSIPRPNAGGSLEMFMTDDQKKYYMAMKRMSSKAPQKSIPRPSIKLVGWIFDLVTNQKFDIGIMIVIMLNMLTMALEHYGQSDLFGDVLYYINLSFIIIFTAECVLKLIGLRHYYFKVPWNIFDFVVVVLSILGVALSDVMQDFLVSPTLLRVVRVFRVGRVLRLVKSAKGIRTLLFSLAVSLPALFNIGLLLFLVMFIYATFGMNFFMHVKHTGGLDDCFNFETFGRSIILLFQMCTSAGWNGALAGITNTENCNSTALPQSDCGNYPLGVGFLVTYLIISFLVVVNMYIAVILENFSQATEDVQQGLASDDFDMYYEKWEKFDPQATQFIGLEVLSDFVDYLEDPLRLPKPNHFVLVKLDIPICENDKMFCRDILDALTKNVLGTADTGDLGELAAGKHSKEKIEYNPVSSTLMRQKEHYAARVIQKAFRRYKLERKGSLPPPPSYDSVINKDTDDDVAQDTADANGNKSSGDQDDKAGSVIITVSENEEVLPENKTVELSADSDVVV